MTFWRRKLKSEKLEKKWVCVYMGKENYFWMRRNKENFKKF